MSGAEPAGNGKKKRRGFEARPGFHVVGHRLALDPNASALQALASHCGAARVAYNWAVRHVLASWSQRAAEETYGVPEAERVAWRSWSLPSLRKAFNEAKHTDPFLREWWAQNSKEAYNTGLANAAAAFDNYAKSRRGERKGARMGRPRFKSKRKARPACKFTTGTIRLDDRRHIVLPRLGGSASTGRPAPRGRDRRRREADSVGDGAVRAGPLVRGPADRGTPHHRSCHPPGTAVGIDLGVKTLLVMADSAGEVREVANPKHYDQALTQLWKASRTVSRRRGPNRRTGQAPSRRWEKANAVRNRVHHRVANLRENHLHQATARIPAEYGTVVVEDLNVKGMVRNRRLSRRISDAAFGELRRQLTYKTQRHGGRLVVADRWMPSSKTCSRCGVVKAKLPLGVRVFECDACGLVLDRTRTQATTWPPSRRPTVKRVPE
ncbi:IS607 family element RNA-guided endonuclease TnpB [Streptomyces mirabilis]|uniref:IS607 family element RNA-guided endonuclease TnpB n=1 Tax=Streptomyces mirabilis TaxID=68239 RepID=UPI00201DAE13|nr:IS607 family element RNA-guided endonuclease TnpB [Streptomyces mirabilis]